ncbi:hypothetical protein HYG86_12940 [Alkalicella caledoniensis]|uniref:Uncharacterized protein n=1 Tax=Alkalicella caledoniensis TaxID=2731377 RepID=A0A7G9WAA2_ALKCA|nr:hypothetical protein [Alkalicella caledoniensis]QNO15614.1 hypothetical protein HYG86_12940 [Alkalicella caledoniensis]
MRYFKCILILVLVAFTGCSVNNAYDSNNFHENDEGIEAYSKKETIEYQSHVQLFSRNELEKLTHKGKTITLDKMLLEGKWTHGTLNYPLIILYDGETSVVDVETKTEIISSLSIKEELNGNFSKLVNNQDLRFGDTPVNHKDFDKITIAQYCPYKNKVAFIIETDYIMGTTYAVVGFYDIQNEKIHFTNISKGGFIPQGDGGDVGPFWSPDGCEFAYTLGDSGDSARYMYVDCHVSGNIVRLDGEVLQNYLDLGDNTFNFPSFKDLKWLMEGNKLIFSTRAHDNSEDLLHWILDMYAGVVELQ